MTLYARLTWTVLAAAFTVAPVTVRADQPPANTPSGAVITHHPTLQLSLNRLYARSASWRQALDAVERLGRRVVVVTPKQVTVKDQNNGQLRSFDTDVLAEVQPLAEHATRVDTVVVVINLALFEQMQGALSTIGEMEDDLDRVMAHEVYGHAVPYLLAGNLSGKCADAAPGQRAEHACAIQRENVIRRELNLGTRKDSGVDGLALARRLRH